MKGDVHFYHVVRQKIVGVKGDGPRDMIENALAAAIRNVRSLDVAGFEYADAEHSYLVDERSAKSGEPIEHDFYDGCSPPLALLHKLIHWCEMNPAASVPLGIAEMLLEAKAIVAQTVFPT